MAARGGVEGAIAGGRSASACSSSITTLPSLLRRRTLCTRTHDLKTSFCEARSFVLRSPGIGPCSLQPRKSNRLICPHCCNKPSTNRLEWNEDHDGLRRARSFQVSPNSDSARWRKPVCPGLSGLRAGFRSAPRISGQLAHLRLPHSASRGGRPQNHRVRFPRLRSISQC
jgi:hypothetical protein